MADGVVKKSDLLRCTPRAFPSGHRFSSEPQHTTCLVEGLGKTLRLGVGVYALVLKGAYLYIKLFNLAIYGRGSPYYEIIMAGKQVFLIMVFCLISTLVHAGEFILTSPTIKSGDFLTEEQVFNGFGCSGKNQSPALRWSGSPKGTKSFAITLYDPDAPTGSGWWHWVVYNIATNVSGLAAGAGDPTGRLLPPGAIQGRTDFGTHAFGGACPPQGDKPHRYIFIVHALSIEKIEVPFDSSAALIGFMINANSLGKASFTARYGR